MHANELVLCVHEKFGVVYSIHSCSADSKVFGYKTAIGKSCRDARKRRYLPKIFAQRVIRFVRSLGISPIAIVRYGQCSVSRAGAPSFQCYIFYRNGKKTLTGRCTCVNNRLEFAAQDSVKRNMLQMSYFTLVYKDVVEAYRKGYMLRYGTVQLPGLCCIHSKLLYDSNTKRK